jgi:hypothetical protein
MQPLLFFKSFAIRHLFLQLNFYGTDRLQERRGKSGVLGGEKNRQPHGVLKKWEKKQKNRIYIHFITLPAQGTAATKKNV